MNDRPFLSVVLPTYNRGHLIGNAIRSVLQQSFADFELIVSNGGSTDNTRDVVLGFDDDRIRYVESDKRLQIGENYSFGLSYAAGEYIIFLADDDAFAFNAFERVADVIRTENAKVVAFAFWHYSADDQMIGEALLPGNSLLHEPCSRDLAVFTAKEAIACLYSRYGLISGNVDGRFIEPFVGNAFYHRQVLQKLQSKKTNPFDCTPADMYLTGAVFYNLNHYYCLGEPLLTCTQWAENMTASVNRKKGLELRNHYENLLNGNTLQYTPLKFPFPKNLGVNALLNAKEDFEGKIQFDVNWSLYFSSMYKYLWDLKEAGVNVSREMDEFQSVFDQQADEIKMSVPLDDLRPKPNIRKFIRKRLPFVRTAINKMFQRDFSKYVPPHTRGSEVGFYNVLEAANFIGSRISRNEPLLLPSDI